MKRMVGISSGVVVGAVIAACSGSTGPTGPAGKDGATGATGPAGASATATPSVSAITPPYAFLERTVDLTIAGNGTSWDSKAAVSFSDKNITVNKVTVPSATGLLVNVTIAAGATIGADDVTVTDGTATAVYKGAFEVRAPVTATLTPAAGVPQGGLATVHLALNDLTTPFDPNTANVTFSSPGILEGQPTVTDFAIDLAIEADVLTPPGSFDITTTSGATGAVVTTPDAKGVTIVARTPVKLTAGTASTGNLATQLDTGLYTFTPAAATQEFVQFTESTTTSGGALAGTVLPKSGKFADALSSGFAVRYAEGTTSTDPFFVVIGDSQGNGFTTGPGMTPANTSLIVFESPATAATEETETANANDDVYTTAQTITTLPGLVSGALGYSGADPKTDVDFYEITVPNAGAVLHAATGGDPTVDTLITIYDAAGAAAGNAIATSDDSDFQEDLTETLTAAGTYYIQVSQGQGFQAPASGAATYQLFLSIK